MLIDNPNKWSFEKNQIEQGKVFYETYKAEKVAYIISNYNRNQKKVELNMKD